MATFPEDANGEVLRQMHEHGVDFSSPHVVEFAMLFPDADSASRCARAIDAQHTFDTALHENDIAGGVDVIARRRMLLDHAEIGRVEQELAPLASRFGGRLDGWGVLTD